MSNSFSRVSAFKLIPVALLVGAIWVVSWLLIGRVAATHVSSTPNLVSSPAPAMQNCADCHEEIVESFLTAPHANTLFPGASVVERYAGLEFKNGDVTWRFSEKDGRLIANCGSIEPFPVDWVFGSGTHAQTPVRTVIEQDLDENKETESWELAVSWYPTIGLGRTLGNNPTSTARTLGVFSQHAGTRQCFECHTHYLPIEGKHINESAIKPGLHCARCHSDLDAHLQSEGQHPMERWSELTPLESVRRCGECHRRSDQMTSAELTPNNSLLIRFAGVGIEQSQCFQRQTDALRMDCLTCHDPHRPSERSNAFFVEKCMNCHSPGQTQCRVEPESENCLDCHMPKVEIQKGLKFTDHWIRIRERGQ